MPREIPLYSGTESSPIHEQYIGKINQVLERREDTLAIHQKIGDFVGTKKDDLRAIEFIVPYYSLFRGLYLNLMTSREDTIQHFRPPPPNAQDEEYLRWENRLGKEHEQYQNRPPYLGSFVGNENEWKRWYSTRYEEYEREGSPTVKMRIERPL